MMSYLDFLDRIIEDGIEGVKITFKDSKNKLEGSIAGFEVCRNKTPLELIEIFNEGRKYSIEVYTNRNEIQECYWFRYYEFQIEWVCNVVSAMLYNQGEGALLPHLPTTRGLMKAAGILGTETKK